jgi:hypothetical protein
LIVSGFVGGMRERRHREKLAAPITQRHRLDHAKAAPVAQRPGASDRKRRGRHRAKPLHAPLHPPAIVRARNDLLPRVAPLRERDRPDHIEIEHLRDELLRRRRIDLRQSRRDSLCDRQFRERARASEHAVGGRVDHFRLGPQHELREPGRDRRRELARQNGQHIVGRESEQPQQSDDATLRVVQPCVQGLLRP